MSVRRLIPVAVLAVACAPIAAGCGGDDEPGWQSAPIIPSLDAPTEANVDAVLRAGARRGNRADVFIKVGDSISETSAFLQGLGCGKWTRGEYADLAPTVDLFSAQALPGESDECPVVNSFSRHSAAAKSYEATNWLLESGGALDPACSAKETPLDCEIRIVRPAYAVILIGTNNIAYPGDPLPGFTDDIGRIAERVRAAGVIPILSTLPPSPAEESLAAQFNEVVYELASSRHLPMINLWRALDPLPNHGLSTDDLHPSVYGALPCQIPCDPPACGQYCRAANFTSAGVQFGYDRRNLIVLQTLRALNQAAESAG